MSQTLLFQSLCILPADTRACSFGRLESLPFPPLPWRVPWKGKHICHHFSSAQALEFSCCVTLLTLFPFLFESYKLSQRAAFCPCANSEIPSPFSHPHSRYLLQPWWWPLVWELPLLSFLQASNKSNARVLFCFWDDCSCQGSISLVTQPSRHWQRPFYHLCQQNSLQQTLPSWDEKLTWTLFWLRSSDLWRSGHL